MTTTAIAHTNLPDRYEARLSLGWQLLTSLHATPSVVFVFAAPTYGYTTLLRALKEICQPSILLGCSSVGEFKEQFNGFRNCIVVVCVIPTEEKYAAGH